MPAPRTRAITLAELSERIAAMSSLTAGRRAELRSAIRSFASVVRRQPDQIIADPVVIRGLVAKAQWRLADLKKSSWANVTSRITRAMELADIRVHRRRRNYSVGPAWEATLSPLPRRKRDDLHRFAGWCTIHRIDPIDVSAKTFDDYLAYLEAQSILARPRERCHLARRIWNTAIAARDPALRPIPSPAPTQRFLNWQQLPPRLLAEVEEYGREVLSPSIFDEARKPIKAITLRGYRNNIRWYVSLLIQEGVAADRLNSLRSILDPDLVKRGLRARLGQRQIDDLRSRPALHAMATALLNVANYVGVQGEEKKELLKIAKKVEHRPSGMCERNKTRLLQFRDDNVRQRLLLLPLRVAWELGEVKVPTRAQALRMQSACLLEILLHLPMRIKNAAALDLSETLVKPPSSGRPLWRVSVRNVDVKNNVPIDGEFSERSSQLIDLYVDRFRPALLPVATNAMFVSYRKGGKPPHELSTQLSAFVERETGARINAHLLRHFAAVTYLEARPGDYETVRRLLGHRQISTTLNFYTGLEQEAAVAHYDTLIAHLRHPDGNSFQQHELTTRRGK